MFENFDDDEDVDVNVDVDKRDDDHADGSEGAGENVAASDLISRPLCTQCAHIPHSRPHRSLIWNKSVLLR